MVVSSINLSENTKTLEAVKNLEQGAGAVDAFGRLRVSNPVTLIDVDHINESLHPLMTFSVINTQQTGQLRYDQAGAFPVSAPWTGGSVQVGDTAFVDVTVTEPNRRVVYQSIEYVPYQPGKSRLLLMTGVLALEKIPGVTFRMGVFDDGADLVVDTKHKGNGFWLQCSGDGSLAIGRRNNAVDTIVPQSEWNRDKLNGTGPSGYVYDPTKTVLMWMDQAWLGVGDVEVGIIHNSTYLVAHTFNHDGLSQIPYTETAALPVRYEVTSDSSFSGSATVRAMCSSIVSDGGYLPGNFFFGVTLGNAVKELTAPNTFYNTIFITPDTTSPVTKPRTIIRIRSLSVIGAAAATFVTWRLIRVAPQNVAAASASATTDFALGGTSDAYVYQWSGTDHNTYAVSSEDNIVATGFADPFTNSLYNPGEDAVFGVFSTASDIAGHPYGLLVQVEATSATTNVSVSTNHFEIQV